MLKLFKSFHNLSFAKWLQSLAFVLFIFLFSALTTGIVSTPLQIINVTGGISDKQTGWDYSWKPRLNNFTDDYLFDYFESIDDNGNYKNSLQTNLFNWEYEYKGLLLDDYFREYYKERFNASDRDYQTNRSDFLGNFIKNNLYAYGNLYNRMVYLYPVKGQESSTKTNYVSLDDLLTSSWDEYSKLNYDQVYKKVVEDLPMMINWNDKVSIDANFILDYSWASIGHNETLFNLEPLNLGKTNNVVVFEGLKNLKNMQDDEVLINNKYAQKNNLKIGDEIELNNFGDETIHQKYKIVGFANKINNVFLENQLSNEYDKINNSVYVYLTENEMENYVSFFYKNSNSIEAPLRKDPVKADVFTTTRINAYGNKKNFRKFASKLTTDEILVKPIEVSKYNNLSFIKTIQLYIVEAAIFIVIGFIMLILSTGFINYCLKKELDQSAPQIGVLKANGFPSEKIAFIFWTRVLMLMLIGFGLGFGMSIPIQGLVHDIIVVNTFVVIKTHLFNPWFITIVVAFIPLLLSLVSFLTLNNYLKKSSLELTNFKSVQSMKQKKFNSLAAIFPTRLTKHRLVMKDALKTFFLTLLLVLANLIILVEFNARTFTNRLIDNWSTVYDKNTNSAFNNGYQFQWQIETYGSYSFANSDLYNMDYIGYNDQKDLKEIVTNDSKSTTLTNEIQDYLAIDRNLVQNWVLIAAQLQKIYHTDINHASISFQLLQQFLIQGSDDYEQIAPFLPDQNQGDAMNEEIKTTWLPSLQILSDSLINPDPLITLNNAFVQEKIDFPVLKFDLASPGYYYKSNENWKLYLVDDNSYNLFNLSGDKVANLKKLQDQTLPEQQLPVIISKHFAKLNNMKINKVFQVSLSQDNYNILVPLKIVGINENDNYSNNIYGIRTILMNKFLSTIPPSPLYNEVFTKRQFLHFDQDNSVAAAKMDTNYFNFFYPTSNDGEVFLGDLVNNYNATYSYVNWFNLGTNNFLPIDLSKRLAQEKVHEFYALIDLLIGATVLIVLVLYLVFLLVNVNEKRKIISTFKALGYNNWEINLSILGKYFISELVAIGGGLAISYLMWWIAVKELYVQAEVIMNNPFSWIVFVIVLVIMMAVLLIGAFSSQYLIKTVYSKNDED